MFALVILAASLSKNDSRVLGARSLVGTVSPGRDPKTV
jgi:hypothetical protein